MFKALSKFSQCIKFTWMTNNRAKLNLKSPSRTRKPIKSKQRTVNSHPKAKQKLLTLLFLNLSVYLILKAIEGLRQNLVILNHLKKNQMTQTHSICKLKNLKILTILSKTIKWWRPLFPPLKLSKGLERLSEDKYSLRLSDKKSNLTM